MTATYSRPDGKNRFQIASASERPLFSAWLDQEFNGIYNVLNGLTVSQTVSADEWTIVQGSFTQASSTSFTVSGNLASIFEPLRAIQFNADSTLSSHIKSSSYDSGTDTTTVVIYDALVPATITKLTVGLVSQESATIPSVKTVNKDANYTVSDTDQIILVDDTLPSTYTIVYDDGQVGGAGYPALLVTLPVASDLPNKLLCVKKVAGINRTIISSHFSHSTSQNADNETVHTNTYDFQIKGDTSDKNRVTLFGVGDCAWFVSNGSNWYELTPEASETVKGIIRVATSDEMTLTAQQLADGEELKKDLAVSPYNVDKNYIRTDASNMRFASNYIFKNNEDNGVASLSSGTITVFSGLGLTAPDGREDDGLIKTIRYELPANLTYASASETADNKMMFIRYNPASGGTPEYFSLQPVKAVNYYESFGTPTVTGTQLGEEIIWFDFTANVLKESTDNGSNWTTFKGAGPIAEFYGNGSAVTSLTPYAPIAFVTRDEYAKLAKNYIVEEYRSGKDWYRVWFDGTIEQGGYANGASVTFLKPYTDANTVTITGGMASATGQHGGIRIQVTGITTTAFTLVSGFGDNGYGDGANTYWYAIGK